MRDLRGVEESVTIVDATDELKSPAFGADEYRNRLGKVQDAMAKQELDAMVCHNLANICYLTGFQTLGSYGYGHYAVIVPARGEPFLLSSDFESHNARLYSWLTNIVTYNVLFEPDSGPVETLAGLLLDLGLGRSRIGYESGHYSMTIDEFQRLRGRLSDADMVDATDLLDQIKIVKSEAEIAVMHHAADLTTAGMHASIEAACEARTDNDIAAAAYERVVAGGGEYFSLQPIVTSGRRSGIPHSTFRRTPLKTGDVVFIEISACYQRYSAPMLRVVSIGEPSSEIRRAFSACQASVETVMEGLKGGASGRAIAGRARKSLRAIAPDLIWHGFYGYSVGLTFPPACGDLFKDGDITEQEELILKPGMVFHCTTSLRKAAEFGVTLGDTVLVTETGCELLTNMPRKLFVK